MTMALKRKPVVEEYARSDGQQAALVYDCGASHTVRLLGASLWKYDRVEDARNRWRIERAHLKARGFVRVKERV